MLNVHVPPAASASRSHLSLMIVVWTIVSFLLPATKSDVRQGSGVDTGNGVGRAVGEGEIIGDVVARRYGRGASSRLSWKERNHLGIGG